MKEQDTPGRDRKWSWQRETLLTRIAGSQVELRRLAGLCGLALREKRRVEFRRPILPPLP